MKKGLTMDTTSRAKDHLGKFYDQCPRRARVAAYVLLAGLFLEVVNGIIWFHGIEGLASMISVAMMFGGVSGEIFFEYRARSADKGTTMPLLQSSAARAELSRPSSGLSG